MTKKKKEELLLVLDYPNVPFHNNLAGIVLREGAIKRKISSELEENSASLQGRYALYNRYLQKAGNKLL